MKKLMSLLLVVMIVLGCASLASAETRYAVDNGVIRFKADRSATYVVAKGGESFHYATQKGEEVVLPLPYGKGTYSIKECVRKGGNTYTVIATKKIKYKGDELGAFKVSSSIIPFSPENAAVKLALELTAGVNGEREKVKEIYAFVRNSFTYDYFKADRVRDSVRYGVDIDATLTERSGVCYDLSALMVAMIRSAGVPARLEIGDGHAWLSVYVADSWNPIDPAYRVQTGKSLNPSFAYEAEEVY